MKKSITICLAFMATIFFLSSCGSNLQITKRHYTKGYYVSSNHVKSSKTKSDDPEKKEIVQVEKIEKTAEMNAVAESTPIKVSRSNDRAESDYKSKVADTEQEATSETIRRDQSVVEKRSASAPTMMANVKSMVKSNVQDNTPSKTIMKKAQSSGGDGHSLLWIIIVVLLILWLLGIISGYAAANAIIHLLVIVAVILLILWLLRLI